MIVDNKLPGSDIGIPDTREVTLISKSKHDQHSDGPFKQFSTSNCKGQVVGDKVFFKKSVTDPNCANEFDFSYYLSETNGYMHVIDFVIG